MFHIKLIITQYKLPNQLYQPLFFYPKIIKKIMQQWESPNLLMNL